MKHIITSLALLFILVGCSESVEKSDFARVENGTFIVDGEPYYFVGTNFWYGAILASEGEGGDRERLERELDVMAECGINNLRILVGADGLPGVPTKVEPTLQREPGIYNDAILDGLDYLMTRLKAKGMKAVLYLNNSWEWSGGYSQYLMWAGAGKAPIPLYDGYTAFMEYVSGFVLNERAKSLFEEHVRFILGRSNRYSGVKYVDDPTIFSWQIGNEPRAFKAENKEAFADWMADIAGVIRALDANHMISTGSEGMWGCENDWELVERIHSIPEISYINLHIWPYNWSWVKADNMAQTLDDAIENSGEYIDGHLEFAARLSKPAVIEEFGFPRDGFVYTPGSSTELRDTYYKYIFERVVASKQEQGLLAGCNFWGWGGEARPTSETWSSGDCYTGDPAQEAQGLNSVFDCDSTIEVIREANLKLNR